MAPRGTRKGAPSSSGSASKRSRTLDLGWNANDDNNNGKDGAEDDHIYSDDNDSDNDRGDAGRQDESDEEEEEENLDAKKVRLAREYLEKIDAAANDSSSAEDSEGDDDDDDDDDRLGRKLQRDRMKREGTLQRDIADKLATSVVSLHVSVKEATKAAATTTTTSQTASEVAAAKDWVASGNVQLCRGHDLTVTCVALQSDGSKAVTGSKDHSVLLWDVEKGVHVAQLCEHWKKTDVNRSGGQVLAVACSDDGRYAAIGKRDATVSIFDIRTRSNGRQNSNLVHKFEGHKGAVTSLAFRTQSLQLFSASEDRCIRHYNLQDMLYMETLYGHQFGVTAIDCHRQERPISVGRDRTARAWKLTEDTHLIFRGGSKIQAADCLSVLKDEWFVTGHEDGHLSLWMTEKKKAVATIEHSHGLTTMGGLGNGILSVATLRGSDVAASGSSNGYLRFWKARTGRTLAERGLDPICQIPLQGYINGIAFGPKARFCVVALGQEHKFGRYERVQGAKNRFGIVKLQTAEQEEQVEEQVEEIEMQEEDVADQSASDSDEE
jgi:ribosomal RNA-processing protein 9